MNAITEIREKLPDAILVKLDLDVVLSKHQIIDKIEGLEPAFGGMAVHYAHPGRRVEIILSAELQKRWNGKLNKGQKVHVGNKPGTLAVDGAYWVGTDRCLYVDLGNGSEAYDITHITPDD